MSGCHIPQGTGAACLVPAIVVLGIRRVEVEADFLSLNTVAIRRAELAERGHVASANSFKQLRLHSCLKQFVHGLSAALGQELVNKTCSRLDDGCPCG